MHKPSLSFPFISKTRISLKQQIKTIITIYLRSAQSHSILNLSYYNNTYTKRMDQQIIDKLAKLIKLYGLQVLSKIIMTIRPMLPAYITNEQVISIVVALSGLISAGSVLVAADIMARVSLFGVNAGVATVKTTYGVVTTTASIATDILIKKPIYLLSYPFRRHSNDKQMQQMLQLCKLQQNQLQQYRKAYSHVSNQPDKVFLIIRLLTNSREQEKDIRVMVGSLERDDRVERLIPLIKKYHREIERDSIQLVCNRSILRMDSKLSTLPRNEFGAVEVYYMMLQTFG